LIEGSSVPTTGKRSWEAALPEETRSWKTPYADITNVGGPNGGAITAGLFLQEFLPENKGTSRYCRSISAETLETMLQAQPGLVKDLVICERFGEYFREGLGKATEEVGVIPHKRGDLNRGENLTLQEGAWIRKVKTHRIVHGFVLIFLWAPPDVRDLQFASKRLCVPYSQLPNPYFSREIQNVVGFVYREPVLSVDIVAVGFKARESRILVLPGDHVDGLSVGFHNLQILVVHPDFSLKVALLLLNLLGRYIKHVAVYFVDLLLSQVGQIVFFDITCGEDERENVLNIMEIVRREDNALQRAGGRANHLFHAPALVVEQDV
jgi:hypothetical protein